MSSGSHFLCEGLGHGSPWPALCGDFDRRDLWRACEEYASRDRRFGGAIDAAEKEGET